MPKLPNDHAILTRLALFAQLKTDNKDWFGVAEQVVGAIYVLSKHPDILCTEIIQQKTKAVFENQELPPPPPPVDSSEDQIMQEAGAEEEPVETPLPPSPKEDVSYFPLSQLLFIVGHVASKDSTPLFLLMANSLS